MNITELHTAIRSFIRMHPEIQGSGVNPIIAEHMTNSLVQFVDSAVTKFALGQRQYGGDIRDKNLKAEIYMEQLDLFWYTAAQTWSDSKLAGIESKLGQ